MSAQTASVNRVLKPQSRAILGLMRLDFLSVQAGVKERFAVQGLDISPSKSTEDFIAELKQEAPSIYRAVKESGAKVE